MNGLLVVAIALTVFLAALAASAPGITVSAVRAATLVYENQALPADLAAAVAAHAP